MSGHTKLTTYEKRALLAIAGGVDVYDYGIAVALRSIHSARPELLTICEPMKPPRNGAAQQPYFGAILTAKGAAIAKAEGR